MDNCEVGGSTTIDEFGLGGFNNNGFDTFANPGAYSDGILRARYFPNLAERRQDQQNDATQSTPLTPPQSAPAAIQTNMLLSPPASSENRRTAALATVPSTTSSPVATMVSNIRLTASADRPIVIDVDKDEFREICRLYAQWLKTPSLSTARLGDVKRFRPLHKLITIGHRLEGNKLREREEILLSLVFEQYLPLVSSLIPGMSGMYVMRRWRRWANISRIELTKPRGSTSPPLLEIGFCRCQHSRMGNCGRHASDALTFYSCMKSYSSVSFLLKISARKWVSRAPTLVSKRGPTLPWDACLH